MPQRTRIQTTKPLQWFATSCAIMLLPLATISLITAPPF